MTEAVTNKDSERRPSSRSSAVSRFVSMINKELSQGDVADLRRLRPEDACSMAFWRIVATALEPNGVIPENEVLRNRVERRWAAAASALARVKGLHQPGTGLGRALASAGFAELRFARLLRATDTTLWDAARNTAAFLASKGQNFDQRQMVELITLEEGDLIGPEGIDPGEMLRRRLAREYYRHIS